MFRYSGKRPAIVTALSIAVIIFASTTGHAIQKKKKAAQVSATLIWADPGEVENLDFTGGPGGRNREPKPPFTFIEESLSGSNPKVRVSDAHGVKWTVKFGSEDRKSTRLNSSHLGISYAVFC